MDKFGMISEKLTRPETDQSGEKSAADRNKLEDHLSKRTADAAKEALAAKKG